MIARRSPELLAAILFLVAGLWLGHGELTADVAWQQWLARQMLGGARLYTDLLEVNPPLWFWMAIPPEAFAEHFGVDPNTVLLTANLVFLAVGLGLFDWMIHDLPADRRIVLLITAVIGLLLVPMPDFAQREQLALAATLPYAALIAARANAERRVDWRLALAIGVFSAFGFALKHYFSAVPVVLEIWLAWRLRRSWRLLRPETVALAVLAMAYAAAILIMAPDYLAKVVPLLKQTYLPDTNILLLRGTQIRLAYWFLGFAVLFFYRRGLGPLARAMALASLTFIAAYIVQQRGWSYHALAATGTLLMALATLIPGPRLRVALAALVSLPALIIAVAKGPVHDQHLQPVAAALAGIPKGSMVVMFTTNPVDIWPSHETEGMRWASRYYGHWMVPPVIAYRRAHGGLDGPMAEVAAQVRSETLQDMQCNPPDVILAEGEGDLDPLAFLREDAAFQAFMSNYEAKPDVQGLRVFQRLVAAQVQHPAQGCRTVY